VQWGANGFLLEEGSGRDEDCSRYGAGGTYSGSRRNRVKRFEENLSVGKGDYKRKITMSLPTRPREGYTFLRAHGACIGRSRGGDVCCAVRVGTNPS